LTEYNKRENKSSNRKIIGLKYIALPSGTTMSGDTPADWQSFVNLLERNSNIYNDKSLGKTGLFCFFINDIIK
jgi:hypothetical protein